MKRALVGVIVGMAVLAGCSSSHTRSISDIQKDLSQTVYNNTEHGSRPVSVDAAKCEGTYVSGHVSESTLREWDKERKLPMDDSAAQADYVQAVEAAIVPCGLLPF